MDGIEPFRRKMTGPFRLPRLSGALQNQSQIIRRRSRAERNPRGEHGEAWRQRSAESRAEETAHAGENPPSEVTFTLFLCDFYAVVGFPAAARLFPGCPETQKATIFSPVKPARSSVGTISQSNRIPKQSRTLD
jgi:hypothetical protein